MQTRKNSFRVLVTFFFSETFFSARKHSNVSLVCLIKIRFFKVVNYYVINTRRECE